MPRDLSAFPAAREHAVREMAGMFDRVARRYDLLNSLMTLGQDRAWRAAMARAVPEPARIVLDLCTGSGVSLEGLLRAGRLVVGVDASLGMLEVAASDYETWGWGPRLVCADAFRLPFRDGAVDAITIAFGMRNLRPRPQALAEMARVLAPGGALVVLEATAPRRGALAPLHAFHARRVIPLLGRLSPDPAAYRYLSESIFEFGAGEEFERDLTASGFEVVERQSYLLGAARLWAAQRMAAAPGGALRIARHDRPIRGNFTQRPRPWEGEWRAWTAAQAVLSAALTASLVWALVTWIKWQPTLHLEAWQERGLWALIVLGLIGFGVRTLALLLWLLGPPPRP
ncbi:MAG TPA: ubiquinone/menaquinone biosynthesis methyltransferase [Terriglobales bacterium]|nr:ubiquinone/menaquinone biosynthesis methyltransferase [Terriglobales bacterium]